VGDHDSVASAVAVPASVNLEPEPPVATAAAPSTERPVSLEQPAFSVPVATVASVAEPMADSVDNAEVATKLELALAYEEMGDKEGARELYQEALMEGSSAQQDIARAKLASLA
jgi:pilus assembly protein FimV